MSSTKLLAAIILLGAGQTYAARSASVAVRVTIRPAVSLTAESTETVTVKIRLAPQAHAFLWKADECVTVPLKAYAIGQSGVYNVSLSEIEGQGDKVCLGSSDGSLNAMIRLHPSESEN